MMRTVIRKTRSLCPVCLKNLPASLVKEDTGRILLEKTCPEHGAFSVPVWQGLADFDVWTQCSAPLPPEHGLNCPRNCGICGEHESGSCCVLLEVTRRCNLRCTYCFADGGASEEDPSLSEMKEAVRDIVWQCGDPLLQLSGGEPTLRDDLPELIRIAKEEGIGYVQVNTNGLRLAQDSAYVQRLAEAGLDIVFLQFDGTNDEIYRALRGAPLLEAKLQAIRACAEANLGVILVPTVVKGVNDGNLGELVRLACTFAPGVRGIHFQPVSYFGRVPHAPQKEDRYTLDALMADLSDQAGVPMESFMPSRCDHPLCGFHSLFLIEEGGALRPLSSLMHSSRARGFARDNREYVARHWTAPPREEKPHTRLSDEMDFDTFLYRLKHESLTLTSMAFQDAENLNIERLHCCTLHVYDEGKIKPFCARYLTPMPQG